MPICPSCKGEFRQRKEGACPGCGAEVNVYSGRWFREEDGAPTVAIIKHLEKRVSDKHSVGRPTRVNYKISPKGARYTRELVTAERLLEAAGWDLDLVLAAIDLLFDDLQFNFKNRVSLIGIETDFGLALAISEATRAAQDEQDIKEIEALRYIQRNYDALFGDNDEVDTD